MMTSSLGTIAALIVLAGTSVRVWAEPPPVRGWFDLSVGALAVSDRTVTVSTFSSLPDGVWDGVEVRSDYRLGKGRVIDIAAGLLITRLIGAGVTINMMNRRGPATIGIRETGVFGSNTLEGSQEIPGLGRADESISVSGVFVVPLHGRLEAKAFGGPSYIRTRLDLIRSTFAMPEFDLTPDGTFSNVRLSPISFSSEEIETSGWGYHVGGTVAVFLTRVLGVGATITYLRADKDIERQAIWRSNRKSLKP